MKICVFGAGAVGGHIAARLAAGSEARGHEVSVVARGAHLEAMRSRGIRLLHGEEVIQGPVREPRGAQDAVFVALKANNLGAFAQAAAPLLGPDTAVVFCQNGIPWWYADDLPRLDPGGSLRSAVPMRNVIGGVVYSANEILEPGVIKNNVPGSNMLVIGQADDGQGPRIAKLRLVLQESGMASPPAPDIRAAVWAKLLQNLGASSLCTITGSDIAKVRGDPALVELGTRLAAEGRAIAQALGVDIRKAPERPGGGQSSGTIGHKPSMLQDYEKGRPMEVEAQLMAPLSFARSKGVSAPTLETVAALVAHKAAAKGLYKLP
jgi:2-dehydropantoate 2-reductase